MDLNKYIEEQEKKTRKANSVVKDHRIFALDYVPPKVFVRKEAKKIIDTVIRYQQTGIPRNLVMIGSRGCGKTLTVKYLSQLLESRNAAVWKMANARESPSSYKLLASLTNVRPRGFSTAELLAKLEQEVPGPAIIVIDEIDLISTEKDARKEILYYLSRSPCRYQLILLTNNPGFIQTLDEATRSSLQLEPLMCQNYTAEELSHILSDRASEGLKTVKRELLAEIAAMTCKHTNSDVRVALKTLLSCVTNEGDSVKACFERAKQRLVVDVLHGLNDKNLILLRACMEESSGLVRNAYQRYRTLCREMNEEPYVYSHVLSALGYLQAAGLITLSSAKINRNYAHRVHLLFSDSELNQVFKTRF